MKNFKLNRSKCFVGLVVLGVAVVGASAFANGFPGFQPEQFPDFQHERIVLTRSVYEGTASTVTVGETLPDGVTATANGSYPYVFNNAAVDGSFAVNAPIYLDELRSDGTLVKTVAVPTNLLTTSFESKSELAVNLSQDGRFLTLLGYVAPVNALDVSNSNTPGHIDPTNPDTPSYQRAVAQIDSKGNVEVTPVDAYSGDNGRAAILAGGNYYMVGNAGNGSGTELPIIVDDTGVQMTTPGGNAETTVVGVLQGTSGSKNGFQYGYSVTEYGTPAYAADKSGKDDNFRGLTIFNNTLYVTKGSGSNGINTVFQVGTAGSLPTFSNASTTNISILPGFSTTLAKPGTPAAGVGNPFGIWFANATTLYVADEGDGTTADVTTDPYSGLQKWSLVNGTWTLDYVITSGLNFGQQYSVANGPHREIYPASLYPATAGLRNITGIAHWDGTVTIYAVTSTISTSGDQGADPNKLVAVTDTLSATNPPSGETFHTLRAAGYGEVYRGVSMSPTSCQYDENGPGRAGCQ